MNKTVYEIINHHANIQQSIHQMAPNNVFLLSIFLLQIIVVLTSLRFWMNNNSLLAISSETQLNPGKWMSLAQPVRYPQLPNATLCGAKDFYKNSEENFYDGDDLYHFWDYLNEYAKLHKRILAGELPLRVIRIVCPSSNIPCEGWGDRLKAIFNGIIIGMITKRAFVFGNLTNLTPDSTIDMFYGNPKYLDWSKVLEQNATYEMKCFRKFRVKCLLEAMKTGAFDNHQVVDLISNIDHSFPLAREFPEFLKVSRIDRVPFWKSLVMQRYFPTKPSFETTVTSVIPQQIPTLGIHVRTGWIKNDDARYLGNLMELIDTYISCVGQVCPNADALSTTTVFATTDNSEALSVIEKKLKDLGVREVITAKSVGEVGHNSRYSGHSNLALRLMVEFEILRRVPVIIVANSGFSLMAHRVRYHPQTLAYRGADTCSSIPTRHEGWYFSVGYW